MSFVTDIITQVENAAKNAITQVEQDVINSITNLLTKAQSGGSVSADEVQKTVEEVKSHFAQAKAGK